MRAFGRALVAAAALVAWASAAQAISARDLLKQCEILERGAVVRGGSVSLPNNVEAAQCWFYMAAVQDFAATVMEGETLPVTGSCPAAATTRMDLVKAYTDFARAHRGELETRASALVVRALAERFPCPARP